MTPDDIDLLIERGAQTAKTRISALGVGVEVHLDRWLNEEIVPSLLEGVDPVKLLQALREHKDLWLTVAEVAERLGSSPRDAALHVLREAICERLTKISLG